MRSKWPLIIGAGFIAVVLAGVSAQRQSCGNKAGCPIVSMFSGKSTCQMTEEPVKNNEPLDEKLTPLQYQVTRCKGTERPFSGKYCDFHGHGKYVCICCGNELFSSDTKFDSGTGWPSFWAPAAQDHIRKSVEKSSSMARTEVLCSRCGAHLGHVFEDGPKPTGMR